MSAALLAHALGGRKTGRTWITRCPAHDDTVPSLAICDGVGGKVLVKCHAGCSQAAVIDALRRSGLWDGVPVAGPLRHRDDGSVDRRQKAALSIWRSARSARSTVVESYLASRGLSLPTGSALRFHPMLSHPSGGTWPGMVALVTRGTDETPLGIHRTFLKSDGSGKAAVVPQRMMLGPCRGGVVRLGAGGEGLLVGEGIETCLAAIKATGRPAWAALSAAGLRGLDLPDDVREVTILADGDAAGETAAQEAARRWVRERRKVRIARAPAGMDFNDLLLAGTTTERETRR